MNCFEVRMVFRDLWRKTLAVDERLKVIGHLDGCATCAAAYRIFALTAPVLHSATPPPLAKARHSTGTAAARIGGSRIAASLRPSKWRAASACISIIAAAGVAAWLASASPRESIYDTLSKGHPAGELFGGNDMPPALDDSDR